MERSNVFAQFFLDTIDRVDLFSGYCNFHFSFILQHILPNNLIDFPDPAAHIEKLKWGALTERVADAYLVTGSRAEGLYVPDAIGTPDKKYIDGKLEENSSDLDLMHISDIKVSERVTDMELDAVLDILGCHPGYLRLRAIQEDNLPFHANFYVKHGNMTFLNSSQFCFNVFKEKVGPVNKMGYGGRTIELLDYRHGPAYTREIVTRVPDSQYENVKSIDVVLAIPIQWPSIAAEWVNRKRKYVWPTVKLRTQILNDGCHVVPVAHSMSTNKDTEWRFSFSKAELTLAHSLTLLQRKCYIIFKLLCGEALVPPKVIPSYYLKTVLYWVCEEHSSIMWCETNLSVLLFILVDRLIHCLSKRCLPNYFIRSNNMIDHLPDSVTQTLLRALVSLRKDPFRTLSSFNRFNRFHGARQPWVMTFRDLMKDMRKPHPKPLQGTLQAAAYSLHLIGFFETCDENFPSVERAYRDMADIMEVYTRQQIDCVPFVSTQAMCMPDLMKLDHILTHMLLVEKLQHHLLLTHEGISDKAAIEANLGRLHMLLAVFPSERTSHEEWIKVAGEGSTNWKQQHRHLAIEHLTSASDAITHRHGSLVLTDLAHLYYLSGEYEKARQVAAEVLKSQDEDEAEMSMYGILECHLFEADPVFIESPEGKVQVPSQSDDIPALIRSTGQVVLPCEAVGLYLLLRMAEDGSEETKAWLKSLQEICTELPTKPCLALLARAEGRMKPGLS